uniref:Putative RING zinc finger protein n=1 Tax=Cryptococcus depauperatus TaxID=5208 RepID=D2JWY2_9TREE|nr:putative RING zinc finger protein [Cryptococcus depauperatus]
MPPKQTDRPPSSQPVSIRRPRAAPYEFPHHINGHATVPSPRPSPRPPSSPYTVVPSSMVSSTSRPEVYDHLRYPSLIPPFVYMAEGEMPESDSIRPTWRAPPLERQLFLDDSEDEMLRNDFVRIRASARGNSIPSPSAVSSYHIDSLASTVIGSPLRDPVGLDGRRSHNGHHNSLAGSAVGHRYGRGLISPRPREGRRDGLDNLWDQSINDDRQALHRDIFGSVGRRIGALRHSPPLEHSQTTATPSVPRSRRLPPPNLWGGFENGGQSEESRSPTSTTSPPSTSLLTPVSASNWSPANPNLRPNHANLGAPVGFSPYARSLYSQDEDEWPDILLSGAGRMNVPITPLLDLAGDEVPPPLNMAAMAAFVDYARAAQLTPLEDLKLSHEMSHDEEKHVLNLALRGVQHLSENKKRKLTDSVLETVEWTWLEMSGSSSCPMCRRDLALLASLSKMVPEETIEHALPYWYKVS